jgi:hypothetical protein
MTTNNQINTLFTSTPTASAISQWDANKNMSANNFLYGYTTTATAASTTTLTIASTQQQFFTGTSTQTVVLPVTSTLVLGFSFYIVNNSSGNVTVQSSGANTVQVMAANTTLLVTCILTSGTTAASWSIEYVGETSGGTVNAGTTGQIAYYASNGNAVSGTNTNLGLTTPLITSGLKDVNGNVIISLIASSSAVNYLTISNSATTNPIGIYPQGSDTNIGFSFTTKGSGGYIFDAYGSSVAILSLSTVASGVNYLAITNAATGNAVLIQCGGSDTNIALDIEGKGSSGVNIYGFTDGSSGATGTIGEVISSVILVANVVSLSNGVTATVTSINLTKGDWDVWGTVWTNPGSGTVTQSTNVAVSQSTSIPTTPGLGQSFQKLSVTTAASNSTVLSAPTCNISVSSTTTIYLLANISFTLSTLGAYGSLIARRVR